jgi:signal transduction histidine kinase
MLIKNLERYDKERIRRYVTTINESGKNTFKLLENLLQWARSQQDKIPFKPETNNLFFLAYETYMLVNQNAKDKLITIDLNVPEDINIEADSEMLKTIIRNLVSNAIKYTTENGKITITGKQTHNEAIIEITDTGIGMNEETKNSLFKIGGSHSKVGTKGESGTGFGLLLCKEFVEKHNGTISVESELGKGSSFTVRLPIQLH